MFLWNKIRSAFSVRDNDDVAAGTGAGAVIGVGMGEPVLGVGLGAALAAGSEEPEYDLARINRRRDLRGLPPLTRTQSAQALQSRPAASRDEDFDTTGFLIGYMTGIPMPSAGGIIGSMMHSSDTVIPERNTPSRILGDVQDTPIGVGGCAPPVYTPSPDPAPSFSGSPESSSSSSSYDGGSSSFSGSDSYSSSSDSGSSPSSSGD